MKSQNTVLVVNGDVDVLALMKGVLQNYCRVLVAADVESALRLVTAEGVRVDLAVIDGNSWTLRLVRCMIEVLPQLRIISMECLVEDGVIRLHPRPESHKPTTSLLESIRCSLAEGVSNSSSGTARSHCPRPCRTPSKSNTVQLTTF